MTDSGPPSGVREKAYTVVHYLVSVELRAPVGEPVAEYTRGAILAATQCLEVPGSAVLRTTVRPLPASDENDLPGVLNRAVCVAQRARKT